MVKKSLFPFFAILVALFTICCSTNTVAQVADSSRTWLKALVNLEQYYVVIDEDFRNPYFIERGDSLRIRPGRRKITIVWKTINDRSFSLAVEPNKTNTRSFSIYSFPKYPKSSYYVITKKKNLRVTTDPNAAIYIDGKQVATHTAELFVNPGKHTLTTVHPKWGKLSKTFYADRYGIQDIARVNQNPSNLPLLVKFVPGAEYTASKRYARAAITYIGLGLLTGNLIRQNRKYNDKHDSFTYWQNKYQNAHSTTSAIIYRQSAQKAEDNLERISLNYNVSLAAAGVIYILSTIDALRKPKSGYRGTSAFTGKNISLSPATFEDEIYPQLTFSYSFN